MISMCLFYIRRCTTIEPSLGVPTRFWPIHAILIQRQMEVPWHMNLTARSEPIQSTTETLFFRWNLVKLPAANLSLHYEFTLRVIVIFHNYHRSTSRVVQSSQIDRSVHSLSITISYIHHCAITDSVNGSLFILSIGNNSGHSWHSTSSCIVLTYSLSFVPEHHAFKWR